MWYCLSTFHLKSRCCHQLALHFTPKYSWHTGADELKYSWVLLHGSQWSKKRSKTTQSWVFLGRHFPSATPGRTGSDGVFGQALVERIDGGVQVRRASEQRARETWGSSRQEGAPGSRSPGAEHRREDARAHAAAGGWGYKPKLNKDPCEKETDPSCRL